MTPSLTRHDDLSPLLSPRLVSLVVLCLHLSLLSVVISISRSPSRATTYHASSAVLLAEIGKMLISLAIVVHSASQAEGRTSHSYSPLPDGEAAAFERGNRSPGSSAKRGEAAWLRVVRNIRRQCFGPGWWLLAVPATLFTCQNNLSFVALSNISVPAFQILTQLKVLTTALFSVMLLHRRLVARQWTALCALAAGVALVQLASAPTTPAKATSSGQGNVVHQRALVGVFAVLLQTCFSGFASVFFERLLKHPSTSSPVTTNEDERSGPEAPSLWARNVQLATFGVPLSLLICFIEVNGAALTDQLVGAGLLPAPALVTGGETAAHTLIWSPTVLLDGFTPIVWLVVVLQVFGGLLAALVIKFADNIAKNFANALSLILTAAISFAFFDFTINFGVTAGILIVIASTFSFNTDMPSFAKPRRKDEVEEKETRYHASV